MPVNADRQKVTIPYSRANKEVTQIIGFCRDLQERKRMHRQLRRQISP